MGQKLSDLRGVLGTMEDRGVDEIRISVESLSRLCSEREDNNGNEVRTETENSNTSSGSIRGRPQSTQLSLSSSSGIRDLSSAASSAAVGAEENGNEDSGTEPSTSFGAFGSRKRSVVFCVSLEFFFLVRKVFLEPSALQILDELKA